MNYHTPILKQVYLLLWITLFPCLSIAQIYIEKPTSVPNVTGNWHTKDVKTIDIDNDNDLDIILANEFDENAILINDGNGNFAIGNQGIPPSIVHDSEDIVLSDFNGDGHLDIIFISEDDFENEYYWNTGNGTFVTSSTSLPYTASNAAAAIDLTNDGMPDLILGNNDQNMILVNDGFGNLLEESNRLPILFEKTHDIKMFDIEGDGDMDMFVANAGTNRLMINTGTGFFIDASLARIPQGLYLDTRKVVVGDIDGDGDMDMFLCNVEFNLATDSQDRLFLNDGNGYFTDATDRLPTKNNQTLDAVFIDFDNDGDQDIITANVFDTPMNILLNSGNQFYNVTTAALNPLSSIEAFGIVTGDFDKDGHLDVYLANAAGKDLVLIRDPDASIVATQDLVDVSKQIKLFPNPIIENFTIDLGNLSFARKKTFQVFDSRGRFLMDLKAKEINKTKYQFELENKLGSGHYFLHIQDAIQKGVKPFFVK